MNTSNAFTYYLNHLESCGRSGQTLTAYKQRLSKFLERWGAKPVGSITPEDVDQFMIQLRQQQTVWADHPCTPEADRPLSPHTIYARGRALQMFMGFCVERGYVDRSPAAHLRLKKPKQRGVKAMKQETAKRLRQSATMRAGQGQNRDLALLSFMLDTGCRSGEVASIRLADVDMGARCALVDGKTGPRRVWFTERTAGRIEQWLFNHPGGEWLFCGLHLSEGRQMNANSIYQMFKRRANDVDVAGRHNPHAVRHLVGTTAVQQLGIRDAQLLLGHEDVNSTLIYAGVDDERVKQITDSLQIVE